VGIGHIRLRKTTGAHLWILVLAIVTTAGTTAVFIGHLARTQPAVLALGGGVLGVAFLAEVVIRRVTRRSILPDHRVEA